MNERTQAIRPKTWFFTAIGVTTVTLLAVCLIMCYQQRGVIDDIVEHIIDVESRLADSTLEVSNLRTRVDQLALGLQRCTSALEPIRGDQAAKDTLVEAGDDEGPSSVQRAPGIITYDDLTPKERETVASDRIEHHLFCRTADGRLGRLAFWRGPHGGSPIRPDELDPQLLMLGQDRLELEGLKWNLQSSFIAEQEAKEQLDFKTYGEALSHACKTDDLVANLRKDEQPGYVMEHFSIQQRGERFTVVDLRPFRKSAEYKSIVQEARDISSLIMREFDIRIRGMLFGPVNP